METTLEKIPYRPNITKYETHVKPYLKDIQKWLSQGMGDTVIRQKLGIDHDTWPRYKKEHSDLAELYAVKKELLVIGLENSLYKKAHGYNITEITKEPVKNDKGKTELQVTKEVAKHVPPDSTALIFALTNLDPENWKHKNEHNVNIQINNTGLDSVKAELQALQESMESDKQRLIELGADEYTVEP